MARVGWTRLREMQGLPKWCTDRWMRVFTLLKPQEWKDVLCRGRAVQGTCWEMIMVLRKEHLTV